MVNYAIAYQKFISAAKKKNAADRLDSRLKMYHSKGEVHHVKPKCLGGDNSISNLVVLHPNDHIYAHLLLNMAHLQKNANDDSICPLSYYQKLHSNFVFRKWLKSKHAFKDLKVDVYVRGKKQTPTTMSLDTAAKYFCFVCRLDLENKSMIDSMYERIFKMAMLKQSRFGYKVRFHFT